MTPTPRAALVLILERNATRAHADPEEARALEVLADDRDRWCLDPSERNPECHRCRVYPCPSGHHGGL